MFLVDTSEPAWGYWIRTLAPIIGLFLIPLLTHLYTSYRERLTRLNGLMSSIEESFDEINQLFFDSVEHKNKSNFELDDEIKDAVREQQMVIQLLKVEIMCERIVDLTHRLEKKSYQEDIKNLRKIATLDKHREQSELIASTRELTDTQYDILTTLGKAKVKGLFKII